MASDNGLEAHECHVCGRVLWHKCGAELGRVCKAIAIHRSLHKRNIVYAPLVEQQMGRKENHANI